MSQVNIMEEVERINNLSEYKKKKLDEQAKEGATVVPGGTGGGSLEAQLHLAEGRHKGGMKRAEQFASEEDTQMNELEREIERIKGLPEKEKEELDERAKQGETVVRGGTGGNSLEAQLHLAEGRHKGGVTRAEELGQEGYSEMGKKGGLTTNDKSGEERAQEEGIEIDESKFRKDQE